MNYCLDLFRYMFTSIKRGRTKCDYSKAKPLCLITLVDFVPFCKDNKIPFGTTEFAQLYQINKALFAQNCDTPLEVPFYHLHKEPFYHLIWKESGTSSNIKHTPSAKFLRENLLYAKLDDELWELLQEPSNREYLKNAIINTYFKD